MSFKDDLEFVVDSERSVGYGNTKHVYKSMPYSEYMQDLRISILDEKTLCHGITTKVKIMFAEKWIMVLDCDGVKEKDMAVADLEARGFGCYVVESSYGACSHFWVFVDFVDDFGKVIREMELSAGVDRRYVHFCKERNVLNLRAFPKNLCLPVFPDFPISLSERMKSWLSNFRDYWYSYDMKFLLRQMVYQRQKKDHKTDISYIGSHLTTDQYDRVQAMLQDKVIQKKVQPVKIINCLHGLEV